MFVTTRRYEVNSLFKAEAGLSGARPLGPISLVGQTHREPGRRDKLRSRRCRAWRGRGQLGELARLRWGGEAGLAACTAKDKLLRTPAFLLQRLVGNRDPPSQ